MALQTKDLLSSSFGGTLEELQELNLSHKGLEDIKSISNAANLLVVNVSYNNLALLSGIHSLSHLQTLDISKNKVTSLKPLSSLSGLQVLKASNNKIIQLSPLAACSSLRELWLQSNQVADHLQLQSLSSLPVLTTLFFHQNPLGTVLKQKYRPAVVAALINLQVLDGQQVSDSDRSSAADFSTKQAEAEAQASIVQQASTGGSHGLPGSLPSSSQPGNRLAKGRSVVLKPKRTGAQSNSPAQTQLQDGTLANSDTIQSDPGAVVGFEGVEQQLPKFDIDKHGNRLDQPFDPYGKLSLKNTIKAAPAGPAESVYQTHYGHTSQHQAVIVWSDGSAAAQYPSEGIAVSVDPDKTGMKGGMRLLATYRSTGLPAVMFEADGTGSVQYPNGNLWMTVTAETGKGALYSHSGEVTQSWSRQAELSAPIELQLDQHLGFSYFDRQPVVYFACEGHWQRFVQGNNPAQACWGDPPVHSIPSFLQKMTEENMASTYVMPPADLSITSASMTSKSGVGKEQLSAISAALEALQSSMMTMMLMPSAPTASVSEESPSIDAAAE